MAKEEKFRENDKVRVLPMEEAILRAVKKRNTLRKPDSIRRLNNVIRCIENDYSNINFLADNINKVLPVKRALYSSARCIKGTESYILDDRARYGIYGFCLLKMSEYTVELI